MAKHVGKHNDRKVVILFREVPDEAHMCLVIYSDLLPRMIHDDLMKAVESDAGQSAKEISEVLHRTYMQDGRIMLNVVHKEGMIKKIPTNQVLVTPNAKSSVRLDELNKILNEMAQGEEAVKRLEDIDNSRGYTGKRGKAAEPREVGMPANSRANNPVEGNTSPEQFVSGVLSDADLAKQRLTQAETMRKNAEAMLAEATRLETEAQNLNPTTTPNGTRKTTKAKAIKKQAA
jgi:hypothetical protein